MQLLDLVRRAPLPAPWSEGDNIPWHEPDFSQRMLKEHLSQAHDAASRRSDKIASQVNWIHRQVLQERATRILDLGCGPGLYTSRFAKLGHACVGIDYSPASIQYATEYARQEKLDCRYTQQDIREANYGSSFGLVMLIFGELNVFRATDANRILRKANQALTGDGLLLIEPHTKAAVRKIGEQGRTWYSSEAGLFSDRPHLCLKESFWDSASATATVRYLIADALTGHVTRHSQSFQAYTDAEHESMLNRCGYDAVAFFPSLTGVQDETSGELMAIVAKKHSHT
jgi:SAM-dependent methyltransferase